MVPTAFKSLTFLSCGFRQIHHLSRDYFYGLSFLDSPISLCFSHALFLPSVSVFVCVSLLVCFLGAEFTWFILLHTCKTLLLGLMTGVLFKMKVVHHLMSFFFYFTFIYIGSPIETVSVSVCVSVTRDTQTNKKTVSEKLLPSIQYTSLTLLYCDYCKKGFGPTFCF